MKHAMKRQTVKCSALKRLAVKRLVILLLASLASLAVAQSAVTVDLDDADFNYYDVTSGYVHLDYAEGGLVLRLSSERSPMKINFTRMVRDKDALGNKIAWIRNDIERRTLCHEVSLGVRQGVTVSHSKAHLGAVMEAYDAALTRLGFTARTELHQPNTRVMHYANGHGEVKVVFNRLGNVITVRVMEV